MTGGRVHLSAETARGLGEEALRRIGYGAAEAAILADHMLDAALCGYEYSGLPKILNIPSTRASPGRACRCAGSARRRCRRCGTAATRTGC